MSKSNPPAWQSRWRTVDPGGPSGSSSVVEPSSTASSTATEVTSFVMEAIRTTAAVSPWVASGPDAPSTAPAAKVVPQSSISASGPGEEGCMTTIVARPHGPFRAPATTGDPSGAGTLGHSTILKWT